ncbi:MAG TPA: response regulator [Leptospiraceae bacterium]|nr:response regulator [Leptospiraceae bacterium]HMX34675.1 response regulator [Leptospiraceae bacterium]HMY30165.1 response regulator [Leptospiraceae bacterium]HMZ67639.1 response regulator [Leptospiraceae bacterium]HNA06586.1 response regulator [Leptospiraceae bacterium]
MNSKPESHSSSDTIAILVVDDNLINRNVMQKIFLKLGYSTDTAEHGLAALEIISKKRYDLIFMDIQMPVMDGLDATREIRRKLGHASPIVIALTANIRNQSNEEGMDDYLTKPITLEDIRVVIEKWNDQIYEKREKFSKQ